jgi:hypothetical protein
MKRLLSLAMYHPLIVLSLFHLRPDALRRLQSWRCSVCSRSEINVPFARSAQERLEA